MFGMVVLRSKFLGFSAKNELNYESSLKTAPYDFGDHK
jgi:hypothetical protein